MLQRQGKFVELQEVNEFCMRALCSSCNFRRNSVHMKDAMTKSGHKLIWAVKACKDQTCKHHHPASSVPGTKICWNSDVNAALNSFAKF